ncbi:hypothetical protein [Microbacterium aurantiacum]|uniref:hypothetical protein n=1 Tax=Microbacterium aurantiacum TaxID=162393 RepID=UPI00342EC6BA
MSENGWREFVSTAVAAGGRIVSDAEAPSTWILADRSGNKVCLVAWPDGAPLGGSEPPNPTEV